ncbi:nitroreductase family protein [Dechloromonas denitrificans]|uniref:nitroreductase family protein n=1 Tax=Dechloromonas denitrificans TaxID=281362 RepID=UPI001CFBFD09|nr:nitroreductase family protein [Dechloromonas denitrificans]UCV06248.1 nitroreductase family protein [Dechloromonas denitrificans]
MSRDVLLKILDLARWAPSGDNTQPWRFEIVSDNHIAVHGHDTRDDVIYDFDGHASQMAHGALLETLRLAASRFGMSAEWVIRAGQPDNAPVYDISLRSSGISEDVLVQFIESRCVQRRPMRTTPLGFEQRAALCEAVGDAYYLVFFESFKDRLGVAKLLWRNAYLRLTCPEAYKVHRHIIEWGVRFSADRIPDQAVGVDPLTAKLMRWVMQSWGRVNFFNRFLFGTIAPRIQLDFVPALACAAHVLIKPKRAQTSLEDHVLAGMAMQRLWLTASRLGLYLQPEMTPVIFRWYVQGKRKISQKASIDKGVNLLAKRFEHLASANSQDGFAFFCRIGTSGKPNSRSVRKELSSLMVR